MLNSVKYILAIWISLVPVALLAEERFALVIGNSAYSDSGFLPNATSDAKLIGDSFRAMGFETLVLQDLNQDSFGQSVDDLLARAGQDDVIAFYFAGHGIQVDGENYLIPVDAALRSPGAAARETISLTSIIEALKPVPTSMIFLDACRNNPWTESMVDRSVTNSRSANVRGGFSVVQAEGDMLITYATLPNEVASDGAYGNSPFARALARHMRTPDAEVSVLMKRVTSDVMEETGGAQRPQQMSQMQKEFYFQRTTGVMPEREQLSSLLTLYPARVQVGEEVSVVADVENSCDPFFVNFGADGKLTPIPRQFFRIVPMSNGQVRYEISPGSRYGLVVQEQDAPGLNRLGFLCEPSGATDTASIQTTLRAVLGEVQSGQEAGILSVAGIGDVEYRFGTFEIETETN
ncbi:MAG: caspase family protein [Tateyamaria sp.]|uniref:caspase family protein n=1 Tax=Tateyamaria sp. TaxID=1929288 RepID=UPI00329E348B